MRISSSSNTAEKQGKKSLYHRRNLEMVAWILAPVGQKRQPRDENGTETHMLSSSPQPHTALPRIKSERLVVYPIIGKMVYKKILVQEDKDLCILAWA